MASTATTNVRLEKVSRGDYPETWDVWINRILDVIDQAVGGTKSVVTTGGTTTLSSSDYAVNDARNATFIVTGVLASAATIVFPNSQGRKFSVVNDTTGAFALTVKTASGSGVAVPQGYAMAFSVYGTAVLVDGPPTRKTDGALDIANAIPDGSITTAKLAAGAAISNIGFTPENSAGKGATNGYASLDVDGKLPSSQMTVHDHDSRYYTEAEVNSFLNAKFPYAGGTILGDVTVNGGIYAANAAGGRIKISPQDINHSGSIEIFKGDGTTRIGIIGYDNTNLTINTESGANLYSNGNLVWTSGNDGAASGLDADLWSGSSKTVSTSAPSGGVDGDIWFVREA